MSVDGTWPPAPIGRVAAPLRDQVLDVVRQGILDFRLRPGQRLIERELMEQLGVSRATVREVIARLASEGLVTIIPQRGAIVTVLTAEEAADIYEMRVSLEGLAAHRFVERATPRQVKALRAAFDSYAEAAPTEGDNLERLRARDGFYRVLFEGAASEAAHPDAHHAAEQGPAAALDVAVGAGPTAGNGRGDARDRRGDRVEGRGGGLGSMRPSCA